MMITEYMKQRAYQRAGGRCECLRTHPERHDAPHTSGRCPREFDYYSGEWTVQPIGLDDCKAVCIACALLPG